ncbi:DUF47 domain-containing protein [Desulfomicrobium escambiense]|uniref:DUF47 domain-containing protein n=1 Tax=Desulfomicrobium escambiense TaxID=29503 RepID=UPI000413FF3F|nr:DUF47 family protein [Desulfomicrobium escambiense]
MAFSIFPRNIHFFELLNRQNRILNESAGQLARIVEDLNCVDAACKTVTLIEADADALCREIAKQLSQTFITPIDREDIYRLNMTQEDSINRITAIASRMRLCAFDYIRFPARKMARNILGMTALTGEMICCLEGKRDVSDTIRKIKELKTECEMLFSTGLAELHDVETGDTKEVIDIMRWTQVYDRFEMAIERIDDLADAIEEVVLKNA